MLTAKGGCGMWGCGDTPVEARPVSPSWTGGPEGGYRIPEGGYRIHSQSSEQDTESELRTGYRIL